MEHERSKLALIIVTLTLLLVLAVGPATPSAAAPVMDHGLPGLCPVDGGGSSAT